jgi:hypothetical protein
MLSRDEFHRFRLLAFSFILVSWVDLDVFQFYWPKEPKHSIFRPQIYNMIKSYRSLLIVDMHQMWTIQAWTR